MQLRMLLPTGNVGVHAVVVDLRRLLFLPQVVLAAQ